MSSSSMDYCCSYDQQYCTGSFWCNQNENNCASCGGDWIVPRNDPPLASPDTSSPTTSPDTSSPTTSPDTSSPTTNPVTSSPTTNPVTSSPSIKTPITIPSDDSISSSSEPSTSSSSMDYCCSYDQQYCTGSFWCDQNENNCASCGGDWIEGEINI